jgi:hypothetical protein
MMISSLSSNYGNGYLAPYNQHFPKTPGLRPIQWPPLAESIALKTLPDSAPLPDAYKPWLTIPGRPYDRLNRSPLPDLPLDYISNLGPHLPHHGMAHTYAYEGSPLSPPLPPALPVFPPLVEKP